MKLESDEFEMDRWERSWRDGRYKEMGRSGNENEKRQRDKEEEVLCELNLSDRTGGTVHHVPR